MESYLTTTEKPFRVGIFPAVDGADKAVEGLLTAGFTKDHITVICSDKVIEQHFHDYEHREPAGTFTPRAAVAGSAVGAFVGGLAAAATATATGGIGIVVSGPLLGAGAIVGGLIGAMTTRGVENELANYYDQAVTKGKILVAAEAHGKDAARTLAGAERILKEAGAEPLPLAEG